ncbi:MAG: alpha/beta hydrolase [Deltaproteobacteria bacterium]|nr:alpha/beta hydrolase [Deltaproteobacteria bacterium]
MMKQGILNDEFFVWRHDLKKELRERSSVVKTARGRIEFALSGYAGPWLAGLHGAPGGYDQIFALYPDMLDKGFRVLSWSRPGYLRTPLKVGETFEEQADALAALMDSIGIDRAALLAYSAGGPVGLHFALRHPDRIWALIMECAVSKRYVIDPGNVEEKLLYSRLMFNDPINWLMNLFARHEPEITFRSMIDMESTLSEDKVKAVLSRIMQNPEKEQILMGVLKSMSPTSLRRRGLANDLEQLAVIKEPALGDIRVPTLVVHGTDDHDVSMEHAVFTASSIPGAELYVVEGGFHIMPACICADEVTARKMAFLKKHRPADG